MDHLRLWRLATVAVCLLVVAPDAPAAPPAVPAAATAPSPTFDRSRLPERLRNIPLERLSSGGLLRLDIDGALVETPQAWTRRTQARAATSDRTTDAAAAAALDPRVGANIRLGEDPPQLPSTTRAQAEPHIARALGNPDFLLATFQEGRFADGGAVDCGYATSHDGGLTWSRALIPQLSSASGGPYPRATDPVAAWAADGDAYLNTLGLDINTDFGAVVVSRSTDGGNTFAAPVVAYQTPADGTVFPDKNWFAINTFTSTASAGRILVTFTRFPNNNPNGFTPIMRTYSDDRGATWSAPAFIHSAATDSQGSQPVFLPDGRLVIVYWNFGADRNPSNDDHIDCVISANGGVTFGPPLVITGVALYSAPSIRDGAFLPSAVGDRAGNIFLVYQAVFGQPRIMFAKSTNGGVTWSAPVPISDNPAATSVFNPAIGASSDGQTLTVCFYSNRDNPGSNTMLDTYLAQSFDGGATWQPNIRLTSVSSDATLAPLTGGGYMLGDYLGIAPPANADVPAVPVWIDTRTGNPDPFIGRVGIAPTLNFPSWRAARFSLAEISNPELGAEAADFDHDGEDNLSEFRSLTDPRNPLSLFRTGRQLNISTRAHVRPGDNALIAGFITSGSESKKIVARAIGPSLAARGVADALQDPTLQLVSRDGVVFRENDNWRENNDAATLEATGLAPQDDRESAILQTLAPDAYTAIVRGKGDSAGVALAEIYDASPSASAAELANLSTRAFVETGENVMIGGVIIGAGQGSNGAGSARILLRAIGPSLAQSGINNPLGDPELQLADGNGTIVRENDNWQENQQGEIQASGFAPADPRESAILSVLVNGSYTAIVRGKNGDTGIALVEAYRLPEPSPGP